MNVGSTTTARAYALAELVDSIAAEHAAADAAIANRKNLGPLIPFPRLSSELGGSWPVGLSCLHAGPGAGKSAICIQCLLAADCPAIYLTCEMYVSDVVRRMIACKTGQYLGRLRRGQMPADGIRAAAEALAQAHPHIIIIDATTAPCLPQMLQDTIAAARQHGQHALVVVDSLHAWSAAIEPSREEYQAVSAGIEVLRRFAAESDVPIVAVVERNRASMTTGGISAGAASRKIEYSAEAVIELSKVGSQDLDSDRVNLKFSKNRNGRAGVEIGYTFCGATQRFCEVGEPWPNARANGNGIAGHNGKARDRLADDAVSAETGYEDRDLFG